MTSAEILKNIARCYQGVVVKPVSFLSAHQRVIGVVFRSGEGDSVHADLVPKHVASWLITRWAHKC